MSSGAVSKLDYLKRYLDKGDIDKDGKKVKKKKKAKGKFRNFRIIDTDISVTDVARKTNYDSSENEDEKPLVIAEDGTTVINRIREEEEAEEKKKWAPASFETISLSKSDGSRRKHSTEEGPKRPNVEDSESSNSSPVRGKRRRHDSPEAEGHHKLGSSSPEGQKGSPDLSPVRRSTHHSTGHKRGGREPSVDLSPPRVNRNRKVRSNSTSPDRSPRRHKVSGSRKQLDKPKDTGRDGAGHDTFHRKRKIEEPELLSEEKVGIQSFHHVKKENEQRKKGEEKRASTLADSLSGRDAATVYRDKSGKVVDLKQEKIRKRNEEEKRAEEDEKFLQWGKGVKQNEDYKKRLEEDVYEMSKPLARYKDDADLDSSLKNQDREGDPMLAFLSKKKAKEKGSKRELPKYKGPAPPPNRFNIWPGYRWDGVDRSNGYEKKRFEGMADKQAMAKTAYKWSVEDM